MIENTRTSIFETETEGMIVPVPARTSSEGTHSDYLESVFTRYKSSKLRYDEFSQDETEHKFGEVLIVRDVDFAGLDIDDPEVSPDDIIKRMESGAKTIIMVPCSYTQDSGFDSHLFLGGINTLYRMLVEYDLKQFIKGAAIYEEDYLSEVMEEATKTLEKGGLDIVVCSSSE